MSLVFAFTTMGHMSVQQIQYELKADKVCPLLVYEFEGETIIPLFVSKKVCHDFLKRNLPREWISGAVDLTPEDLEVLCEQDHLKARKFEWPRKIKDLVIFNVHIHEFVDVPDVTFQGSPR